MYTYLRNNIIIIIPISIHSIVFLSRLAGVYYFLMALLFLPLHSDDGVLIEVPKD